MQPITIDGQAYLTTQRIHQDYIQNTRERGEHPKYVRHPDFVRVIRVIPSYDLYIVQRDILHVDWRTLKHEKSERKQILLSLLQPLFAAAGYNQLTFLNEKAQLELTHHLDDELNKEIAYRHTSLAVADKLMACSRCWRTSGRDWLRCAATSVVRRFQAMRARSRRLFLLLPDVVEGGEKSTAWEAVAFSSEERYTNLSVPDNFVYSSCQVLGLDE